MYYLITWEVERQGFIGKYARGYEIFTTKKARDEYLKIMDKNCTIALHEITAKDVNYIIDEYPYGKKHIEPYGVVESVGAQFH